VPHTAAQPNPDRFPTQIAAELDAIPRSAVLHNTLLHGGYLAWSHAGLRITGDGLSDQYPVDWLVDYMGSWTLQPGWEDFLARSGATYVLAPADSAMSQVLDRSGWQVIAEDRPTGYVLLHQS
jgi:hypothetical protein